MRHASPLPKYKSVLADEGHAAVVDDVADAGVREEVRKQLKAYQAAVKTMRDKVAAKATAKGKANAKPKLKKIIH